MMTSGKGRNGAGWRTACAALAMLMMPVAAQAQFSDSFNFLKAVKDKDGTKATELMSKTNNAIVDTRDRETGRTALHYCVDLRDTTWLGFLLGKGARPDIADNDGNTPLMLAAQLRFVDGARYLLSFKAQVDKPNRRGETPLIRAVQLNDVPMVNLLIENGANPDKRDTLAGMSARDYAARDIRSDAMTTALNKAKPAGPKKEVQGPSLN